MLLLFLLGTGNVIIDIIKERMQEKGIFFTADLEKIAGIGSGTISRWRKAAPNLATLLFIKIKAVTKPNTDSEMVGIDAGISSDIREEMD